MTQDFRRDYLVRLPLPLAQLYARAHNAKDARARHDNTFYLFEALIKLAAAPGIACYLQEVELGSPRSGVIDGLLLRLAMPSLGHWLAMLRELARHFGGRAESETHPLGHAWGQLNRPFSDRPALLDLYRRIKNGPDGDPAGDRSGSILQILDALVVYRNGVFGHGGPRFGSFYADEMGPLLFPAANELLAEGMLDLLGPRGSRLVHLTELRMIDEGSVEVGLRDLVGMQGERAAPLVLDRARAATLATNCVAVSGPAARPPSGSTPSCSTARASWPTRSCSSTATATAARSNTSAIRPGGPSATARPAPRWPRCWDGSRDARSARIGCRPWPI